MRTADCGLRTQTLGMLLVGGRELSEGLSPQSAVRSRTQSAVA
jgi:hypothetical protein